MPKTVTVRDIPVELWIKIIGSLMGLLLIIGTTFGSWIGRNIETMAKDISSIANVVGVVNERSLRNKEDIVSLRESVKKNTQKISDINTKE